MKKFSLKEISETVVLYKIELSIIGVVVILLGTTTGIVVQHKNNGSDLKKLIDSRLVYEADLLVSGESNGVVVGDESLLGIVNAEYDNNAKDLNTVPSVNYGSLGTPNSSFGTTTSSSTNVSGGSVGSTGGQTIVSQQVVRDYSSLTGTSARISEGQSFNPLNDLKLSATDKDGTNINHKIEIVENNVDIYRPGHYTVKARVQLSNGATLTKQFNVEVVYQPLTVNIKKFTIEQTVLDKEQITTAQVEINSSKSYVNPVSIQMNNKTYPLTKVKDNVYSFTIQAPNESGQKEYTISSVMMSDQSMIKVNRKATVTVKKELPTIEQLSYEFNSVNEQLILNIKLSDLDNAIVKGSYAKAILIDSNQNQVGQINVISNQNNTLYFNVPNNGDYVLKVVANVDLTGQGNTQTVELTNKSITISSIDRTNLTGKNVTIQEGSNFNVINDLQLKATDKDGSDITNQIVIEGDVDTTSPGIYTVKASVINSEGEKIEQEFTVTVKAVATKATVTKFETEVVDVPINSAIDAIVELNLSKDYVELTNVTVNDKLYPVKRISETNQYKIEDIQLPSEVGAYTLKLTKLQLSSDEEFKVNHSIQLNMVDAITTFSPVEEQIVAYSNEAVSLVPRSATSRNAQVSGTQSVSDLDTNTVQAQVNLSGMVRTIDGTASTGRIEVTLPTAISFVVDQEGNLQLPTSLLITNNSPVGITLSIAGFTESQPQAGITVQDIVRDTDSRSTIALRISGNTGNKVSLLHNNVAVQSLLNLGANSSGSLIIEGEAGKENKSDIDTNGVNETFTVTFSVKKQ